MDCGLFDVLFLSDTWFPKTYNFMSHPYSFLHSTPDKVQKNSRQSGGILVLVSLRIRPLIRSHHVTPYGILLDLDGTNILGVYLPPSFSPQQLDSILGAFPKYSLLFGDLNVRFKNITAKAPSARPLQQYWHDWLDYNGFSMVAPDMVPLPIDQGHRNAFRASHSVLLSSLSPTVGEFFESFPNCELDHLFQSHPIVLQLRLLNTKQFNLKTVHPYFLQFRIPLATSSELELREGLGRFHLELLEKPGIPDILSQAWSKLDDELNWDSCDVDWYDSMLTTAEEVLGIYDVLER